jgi:hypothetical protein
VVYHDDIGDYLTNEPIMDGTADAVYMMAFFGRPSFATGSSTPEDQTSLRKT